MRQPNWTRDEFIVALDVYFEIGPNKINKSNPAIIELSNFLRSLPIHQVDPNNSVFRNPEGVSMEIENFVALDPQSGRNGLPNSGRLQKQVWKDFSENRYYLHEVAMAIRRCIPLPFEYSHLPDLDQSDFMEGTILYQYHKCIECNPRIVGHLMSEAMEERELSCSVCGFNFFDHYGKSGYGFMEYHYSIPVKSYTNQMNVDQNDFLFVCSNCHRMLHRGYKPTTLL